MVEIDKIIRTLDLAKSDAREETLVGIIKYVIYSNSYDVSIKEISDLVKKELSIEVHKTEINECIDKLIDNNIIEKNGDKIKLTQEENLKIKQQILENKESTESRFKGFTAHVKSIAGVYKYSLNEENINLLWSTFLNYLHESYLYHGKNAIINFTSNESSNEDEMNILIKKSLKSINDKNLEKIFTEYLKKFPSLVDSSLLKYLKDLADKTEAFYALGLSKEDYERIYENLKFDWIIFVDTNFLYSILNLHNDPEDEAAKAVLQLGRELGIQYKYIPKTYEELNNKKKDFDKHLERNLEIGQVRALLASGKLDNFATNYYEKKLNDPINTPHPTDIIKHSQKALANKGLQIYQSKFERLTTDENFLLDEESKYSDFFSMLDEFRTQKGLKAKGKKNPLQIAHDIFLREAILSLRKRTAMSLQDAKYFGLTLDKTLIKYDHHMLIKKSYGAVLPTFFKPSILLKKLLKYQPVATDDYLRAFVKTISTPALDDNNSTSKTAIRSVRYFHKMGIDDERLILECLKEEMFLTNFESKENDELALGEFIESEINKKISESSKEIEELRILQTEKDEEILKVKNVSLSTNDEKLKLGKRLGEVEAALKIYERELQKINSQSKNKQRVAIKQLTIEDEEKNIDDEKEIKKYKKRNEELLDKVITSKIIAWKHKGYIALLGAVLIVIFFLLIISYSNYSWNYIGKYFNSLNEMSEIQKIVWTIIFGFVATACTYLLVNIFWKRICSEEEKENYIKKLKQKFNE